MNFDHERNSFLKSLKQTPFPKISSKKVVMEMVANGVAAVCAFIVYKILQNFVVVKSVKNLWGFSNKKDKMMVSKETFETISGIFIFIIAIFVFTYVEALIENYLKERGETKD
jgi:CDP-diglyceride synthetase